MKNIKSFKSEFIRICPKCGRNLYYKSQRGLELSKSLKGDKNLRFGKTFEEIYGEERSKEIKRKMRLFRLKMVEKSIKNGHQINPNYNSKGCQYFNKLMEQTNTYIQHAEK